MKNKTWPLLMVILISGYSLNAQILRNIMTPEQEMIREATKGAFYIAQVDYVLKGGTSENPVLYGQGNARYFNRFYYFAVNADSTLYLPLKAATPWLQDPDFDEYRNVDTIAPVLSSVRVRPVNGFDFQTVAVPNEFPADSSQFLKLNFIEKGLTVSPNQTDTAGWVVNIHLMNEADADTLDIRYSIYKQSVSILADGAKATIREPSDTENYWGGVFLMPEISTGLVRIDLWGFLTKSAISGWYVEPAFNASDAPTIDEQPGSLTPIEGN